MITAHTDDGLLTLTIDNEAQANALTAPMLTQLTQALRGAGADSALRAVLLRGAGERGFSAGMDTAQFDHADAEAAAITIHSLGEVCAAVKECPLPVAAAMHGYCVGGALEIAAAADFRVGSRDSWYSMPEVRIGIPSVLEASNLPRLMGWTKAVELMLTARRFSADEMERCGFLNAVGDDVEDRALGYLRQTTEASRSVIAVQKRLLRTWRNTFEREAIADSEREFALAFAHKALHPEQ